jgi:arylsulfatase
MNKKPNILHLFTDMQRFDTIHALGNGVIKTPNLDRLVKNGVAFTSCYSPSPVCISARCSMIYGQYPNNTGCYENTTMPEDGRQSFMGALTQGGYRTHGIGKCHYTGDTYGLRGFESREVQEEGGITMEELPKAHYMQYLKDKGYDHLTEAYGIRGELYYTPQVSQMPADDHPTQWIGDRSINFIEEQAKSDQPWHLYSSFIHPHPPVAVPTPWHKLYRPTQMPLPNMPEDYESMHCYINRVQNRYKYQDQGRNLHLIRAFKAFYYASISFVDYQVGRILDSLEKTGQLENTLILFSSDHGEHLGDYNCWGKRSMHDSAARVPMIISQKGRFDGGRICEEPVSLVDVAPTFLGAANLEFKDHKLDGEDMKNILEGSSSRKYVFSELSATGKMTAEGTVLRDLDSTMTPEESRASCQNSMIVSREWKYWYSGADNKEFLIDRLSDPRETRNLKGNNFCKEAKAEHKQALMDFMKKGGETACLSGDNLRTYPKRSIDPDPDSGLLIQDGYTPWTKIEFPRGY